MIINTRKVETYIFELDGDFYIEVAETAKKDFFEFYISHKDYAVKDLIGTYKCKEKDIRNIVKEEEDTHVGFFMKRHFYK